MEVDAKILAVELHTGYRSDALLLGKVMEFLITAIGFVVSKGHSVIAKRFTDQNQLLRGKLGIRVGRMQM